ncbi:MAG: hypothetical protein K2J15_06230 [Muribaculaceae bacterium]|nr:hypothetical protein [Muribaculaceae bacterium]
MTYQEATALLEKYPYFAYAALMALPQAPDEKRKDELRRIVAVNIGNPIDIAEILGLNSQSLADFYPDTLPPQLSTFDTIDTFLTTFGEQERHEAPLAGGLHAVDLQPSLADEIEALPPGEAGETRDATTDAIDSFLRNVPPPQPRRQKLEIPSETEEAPALTESFARILIKNRNYKKALQIIQELNLKNPEKSIYFADQIRFLKKLIINQSPKGN